MARRSDKLREELAALDEDVIRDRGATRRMHKAIPAIGAFVAMLGFGTVTWYAYNQGILEGSEDAAPLLRPKGALKAPPSNPGGVDVPNRDKYVFNTLEQREDDQKVERLLPPPEQPKELPPEQTKPSVITPLPKSEKSGVTEESASVVSNEARPRTANEALKKALDLVQKDAPPPLPPPGSESAVAEKSPATETVQLAQSQTPSGPIRLTPGKRSPTVTEAKSAPSPPPPPALKAPRAKPAAPKAPKSTPKPTSSSKRSPVRATSKGYYIQLGALRSASAAKRAWSIAKKKNLDVLRGRTLSVERANVPKKGVYYRVQSGPFADSRSAKRLCDALKRRKQGCFVVRRK
jgi:cell division septation protein DedD